MQAETVTSGGRSSAVTGQPVILVVEDEEIVRVSAAEYLRFSDFQVLEAATADDAVALLTSGTEVDLVFSDIRMPGRLDGYGLAKWLRANHPTLPVLLTSGFVGVGREQSLPAPMLAKPYSFDGLLRKIAELLPEGAPATTV